MALLTPTSTPRKTARYNVGAGEVDEVYKKVTRRLVPLIFASYLLAFLDRINVGYAQLQMKDALGFSDAVYGIRSRHLLRELSAVRGSEQSAFRTDRRPANYASDHVSVGPCFGRHGTRVNAYPILHRKIPAWFV